MATPDGMTVPTGLAEDASSLLQHNQARLRRAAVQAAIVSVVAAILITFGVAVSNGLAKHGIGFSFGYLSAFAGIEISEGKTIVVNGGWPTLASFASTDTNAQALVVGFTNTLKVATFSIFLSTIFGTILGVGRLSTNWIIRQGSFGIVEFIRNTPLLIQLVFWYFGVVLQFPPAAHAASLFGGIIASQQGVYVPALVASEAASTLSVAALVLGLLALAACGLAGMPGKVRWVALGAALVSLAASVALGFPLALDYPVASRFETSGGVGMTPEMSALLLAIVVNSAAYIAEIVRGTIESLPKGQWEASAALGMSRSQTLWETILPQVFRIVLPSFGNQYISLTKNTALGIAIGYPDLFNVNGTVSNQTGRNLEGIVIVMTAYLFLSWTISACVNLANVRLNKEGRP